MKHSRLYTIYDVEFNDIEEFRSKHDGKFHYLYRINNLINNKYYYGIHSTINIDDNYAGSGTMLNYAYKKYGKDNFEKHILKFFESRTELSKYEEQLVNIDLLNSEDSCYNMIVGGNNSYCGMVSVIDENGNQLIITQEEYEHNKNKYNHHLSGRVHINNGLVTKTIPKQYLTEYLDNGWNLGESSAPTKGKIVISKDGYQDKFIYKDELQEYLDNGWERKGKSRNKGQKSFAKNCTWINNGEKCIRVNKDKLQEYLDNGWMKGSLQRFVKGYIRITNGIEDKNFDPNDPRLQEYLDNGWMKGSHVDHSGRKWVHKDGKTQNIKIENIQKYLEDGWVLGRDKCYTKYLAFTLGKIAINNGDITKMIFPEELQEYLDAGWKRGNPKSGGITNRGKIKVNKDSITKMIFPEELQEYLNNGWEKGNPWSNKEKRVRVINDHEEKLILISQLQEYLDAGWRKGCFARRPNKDSIRKN